MTNKSLAKSNYEDWKQRKINVADLFLDQENIHGNIFCFLDFLYRQAAL